MHAFANSTAPENFVRRCLWRALEQKAVVVFCGMCASIAIGIAFQSLVASRLGTGRAADVFYLGITVPTLIATALLGSAPSALIRFAVDKPNLLRLTRRSVSGRLMLFAVAAGALTAALGVIEVGSVVPFPSASERPDLGAFLLITSPVPVLALLAALGSVRALARQRFFIATFGGAANGVGLLGATLLFSLSGLGLPQLALAVDCGYMAQLALVWRALRSIEGKPGENTLSASHQRAPVAAFAMLLFASSFYKSQPLVERVVGSVIGSGVPAALGYADKVTSGFVQLGTFGFALAALPLLSRELSDGRGDGAAARLSSALEATCASTVAVVSFALVSSGSLVKVLYERGTFGATSAHVTRELILFALPSVFCGAVAGPLVALEYAAGNIKQVVLIGLGGFAAGTFGTAALAAALGYRGIVLGTALGYAATLVLFARRTAVVLPGWSWRSFASRVGLRVAIVASTAATLSLALATVRPSTSSALLGVGVLGVRLAVVLASTLGVLVYLRSKRALPHAVSSALGREVAK